MCLILHLILIWCEKFEQKRTLVNMLISGLALSIVEYLIFVTLTDTARYFFGPLPHKFCLVKTTLTLSLVLQMLFFVTSILLTKYVFIFHLKNPTGIADQFWIIFLTIWIRSFAYLSQIAASFVPGKVLK